jgi:hypothetical protein
MAADDRLIDAIASASVQSRSTAEDEIERTLVDSFLAWRGRLESDAGERRAVGS